MLQLTRLSAATNPMHKDSGAGRWAGFFFVWYHCCTFAGIKNLIMKLKDILIGAGLAAFVCMASSPLAAQTKAETKLYNTAIAKGDLKSAYKFLAKFPQSAYAPKIQRLKDSIVFNSLDANDVMAYISFLEQNPKSYFCKDANRKIEQLNKSSISEAQAMEIALGAGLQKEQVLAAQGVKNRNRENVVAVLAPQGGYYKIVVLSQEGGNWSITGTQQEQVYTNDSYLEQFTVLPGTAAVTINGAQHLFFCYTNSSSKTDKRSNIPNNNCELAANLYSLDDNSVYNVLYSGKMEGGVLYGSTMESAQGGLMANPQQVYLMRYLKGQPNLKPYDKEMFRTQETIQWWYENNPQNAGNLQFGIIPSNSELAARFKEYKEKETVGQYVVSMFDICHNTVVVVFNKADKVYSLALCQPAPQNDKDLELNTFYGEKGNTLVLYYYQGKNAIKKRLNLGSKRMY